MQNGMMAVSSKPKRFPRRLKKPLKPSIHGLRAMVHSKAVAFYVWVREEDDMDLSWRLPERGLRWSISALTNLLSIGNWLIGMV